MSERMQSLYELVRTLTDPSAKDERRENAALALARLGEDALVWLRDLLQSQDADHRWWAARALAAYDNPSSLALLIETLSDSDPDVRACAALGLGTLAALNAVAPLVHLLGDKSAYVGRIAGNALIQIGQPAAPALIEALRSASSAVRAGAARALITLECHDAIPALFAVLDDESALVTHYAEEALWRMGVGMVLIKP
jgi:HEAT repeat protein